MPPRSKATAPTTRLVRRNYGRGHGYQLDGQKVVGVTTALDVIDKPALRNWYAEQAAKRAVDEWDTLAELPVSERMQRIRYGARDTVQAAALRGTQIHKYGEALAHGEEVDVAAEHQGPVEAYARWLDKWQIETIAVETPLANAQHRYAGTADLWGTVGALGGIRALLDVKTGKGVYDEVGLQLAAYRYHDLIQVDGVERGERLEVDAVFVAHVLPDDVRMLPVVATEAVWRTFLYALTLRRQTDAFSDWPLVGSAIQPGDDWEA